MIVECNTANESHVPQEEFQELGMTTIGGARCWSINWTSSGLEVVEKLLEVGMDVGGSSNQLGGKEVVDKLVILGSIDTDQWGTVVIETVFNEVTKILSSISVDHH
ncbi:hypothetical protein Tco_0138992 [Tanacetum coccineum]